NLELTVRYNRTMLSPRDLHLLPVFVAVAKAGSFTAAGRELGLAKSVVSQHLRTLEERCQVRLIERSTRRLRLTQVGEKVLERANDIMTSVRSLETLVEGDRLAPTGTLRMTAPLDPALSAMVGPIVANLTRQHPTLKADVVFDDAIRDLVKDGFDLSIRLGSLTESRYIVRRLGTESEIIVASPAVVDERPEVLHPRSLANAPWVIHSALTGRSSWTFRSEKGEKVQITVDVKALTNTIVAMRDLLLAGAGFGVVPRHVVRDDLEAGRLRQVCRTWSHGRISLHALLPTRQTPPRVRLFLDALASAARPLGFDQS
ncbi:MAG TPA: LysR family transcriptional regulator, partial [Polyangia bacterium]